MTHLREQQGLCSSSLVRVRKRHVQAFADEDQGHTDDREHRQCRNVRPSVVLPRYDEYREGGAQGQRQEAAASIEQERREQYCGHIEYEPVRSSGSLHCYAQSKGYEDHGGRCRVPDVQRFGPREQAQEPLHTEPTGKPVPSSCAGSRRATAPAQVQTCAKPGTWSCPACQWFGTWKKMCHGTKWRHRLFLRVKRQTWIEE